MDAVRDWLEGHARAPGLIPLAARLRQLRHARGLSNHGVVERARRDLNWRFCPSHLSLIEGARVKPKRETVLKLAEILEADPNELLRLGGFNDSPLLEARKAAGALLHLAVCLGLPAAQAWEWRQIDWLREAEARAAGEAEEGGG